MIQIIKISTNSFRAFNGNPRYLIGKSSAGTLFIADTRPRRPPSKTRKSGYRIRKGGNYRLDY